MFKKLACCLVIVFLSFLVFDSFTYDADARSRGGSFSRSFSRSFSSSTKAFKSGSTKSGSFGRRSISTLRSESETINTQPTRSNTKFTSTSTKSGSFGKSSSENKVKFTKPKDYTITNKPTEYRTIYQDSPSFGTLDTLFLFMMFDSINNSKWFYNHQNDEDVKKFKAKLEEESKNNEELKAKLDKLNAEMEKMKENGEKVNENYISPEEKALADDEDGIFPQWLLNIFK